MRFFATITIAIATVALLAFSAANGEQKGNQKQNREIAAGRDVFNRVCVSCHGKEGGGTPMARPLNQRGGTYGDTPEQIADVVRNGVKGTQMRAFKGDLKEQQIKAVAAYIASLRK